MDLWIWPRADERRNSRELAETDEAECKIEESFSESSENIRTLCSPHEEYDSGKMFLAKQNRQRKGRPSAAMVPIASVIYRLLKS